MDKEAQEKIAFEFYNARALAGDMLWSQASAVGGVMVDLAYAKATQVLKDLGKLGYRKIKDKPPLLSDKELDKQFGSHMFIARTAAKAQREADIKFYIS